MVPKLMMTSLHFCISPPVCPSILHFTPSRFIIPRAEMAMSASSASPPPLPEKRIVVGCGAVSVDYLATVASFPNPDDKIRSLSLKVEGGGNTGNAMTGASRLGLTTRIISKIADDVQGRNILKEFEKDGVDTSHLVVEEGNSPFTYIIVDNQTKTRTCIHTPGFPPMEPKELSNESLFSALENANLVYFDVRLHETALIVAQEASRRKIPILIDAERKREGLDELLNFASYVVCSEKFPMAWTNAQSTASALVSMLINLPNLKFVIVTMGEKGSIMLQRSLNDASEINETDVDILFESLQEKKLDENLINPTCISSEENIRISADGIGSISGTLFIGTAEKIAPAQLIDTTGAGDAFIGAVLYGLCAGMKPQTMLPFASQVAASGCRALGARSGLPWRTDPRLAPFWI
ncbi:hypothetical protein LUZ60_012234 [Juncus effusus]|nr:hypothetical protein LUZ60_012234 [Juncus effusus]